jgi:outer membrane protein OmpA-like peptidoglycan-associated protein
VTRPIRAAIAVSLIPVALHSQKPDLPMPPVTGLSMVMTLSMKIGDRESVHTVQEASPAGLQWTWNLIEVRTTGDTVRERFRYRETDADIRDARRFWAYHELNESDHPGYTMHAFSRAVYRRLRAAGSDSFQIMTIEATDGSGMLSSLGMSGKPSPVRWRGTIALATPAPVPFPLLVNGKRVNVPALHLRGQFAARERKWTPELWILADSTYPMLLKWVGSHAQTENVLQTIRIDWPQATSVESLLAKECRAELPGVYFAFNSAALDSASNRAIQSVADILGRHPDWSVTLEGHTDSVGSASANKLLSERRVAAVKDRLVAGHRVDAARLRTTGFGSARPREANTTIEGRARNRRVELVRECAGS